MTEENFALPELFNISSVRGRGNLSGYELSEITSSKKEIEYIEDNDTDTILIVIAILVFIIGVTVIIKNIPKCNKTHKVRNTTNNDDMV